MEKQIKSKSRVSAFGEVYTAKRQVMDMVDLVDDAVSEIRSTVLEPACGNGNFLAEILARKLKSADRIWHNNIRFERAVLTCVASLYGVDIQKDNVVECRERLYRQTIAFTGERSVLFHKTVRDILKKNIMCGDTLTMTTGNGDPLTISEWDIRENGSIISKDVYFQDMVENGGESTKYIRKRYKRWLQEETELSA